MRKSVIISLIVVSILSVTGCDWIRGQLGMPTSAELDAYRSRKYVSKVDTSVIPVVDSALTDSLSKQANTLPAADSVKPAVLKRFYIVAGSFKDSSNVRKMENILRKNGYTPFSIAMKNGFTMVTAGAFDTETEAFKEMRFILEKDFSAGDLWVYDANTKKHK
ncbi:MAG: SPOR domain-containing protein [Rikenellaceae bacterium]|nr:SPOR domain-containing protein [Rikenellaceae bacterium]